MNKCSSAIRACLIMAFLLPVSSQSYAADYDKWKIRLRGIAIAPDDDSGQIIVNNTTSQGSGVEVDAAFVPEFDLTYMITPHWGIEAIAGIANHDVNIDGTPNAGSTLTAVGATDGLKLFDTWVLPPTVTLQYHFLPESKIRPYVGVGVNYTAFLADNATSQLEAAVGGPVKVSTENSWGYAFQAGVDYDIDDKWFLNADVKYIDISTAAKLGVNGGVNAGTVLNVDVDVDPWVFGVGVGYRF